MTAPPQQPKSHNWLKEPCRQRRDGVGGSFREWRRNHPTNDEDPTFVNSPNNPFNTVLMLFFFYVRAIVHVSGHLAHLLKFFFVATKIFLYPPGIRIVAA